MDRIGLSEIRIGGNRFSGLAETVRRVLFALFLLQLLVVAATVGFSLSWFRDARWPEGLLLVLASASVLGSVSRGLPTQNVLLAAVIIAVIAGGVASLGALTGIPFGPCVYKPNLGQQLFYPLPWAVPFIWLVAVLTSRGVARLVLRPWRKNRNYGFQFIGLSVGLVVLFDAALEPFAAGVRHYWSWTPTKIPVDWYGAPIVNFLGWAVTALGILVFATPALINKMPVKHPPEYQPLMTWLALNVFFLVGVASQRLWPATIAIAVQVFLVGFFAIRGARW